MRKLSKKSKVVLMVVAACAAAGIGVCLYPVQTMAVLAMCSTALKLLDYAAVVYRRILGSTEELPAIDIPMPKIDPPNEEKEPPSDDDIPSGDGPTPLSD